MGENGMSDNMFSVAPQAMEGGVDNLIGAATAYADAVQAGYTGTREQWAEDMAKLGENLAAVRTEREKAEDAAQAAVDARDTAVQTINTARDNAVADVNEAADRRIEEINAMGVNGTVRFDEAQDLTEVQQEQARANVRAASADETAQLKSIFKTGASLINIPLSAWSIGNINPDGVTETLYAARMKTTYIDVGIYEKLVVNIPEHFKFYVFYYTADRSFYKSTAHYGTLDGLTQTTFDIPTYDDYPIVRFLVGKIPDANMVIASDAPLFRVGASLNLYIPDNSIDNSNIRDGAVSKSKLDDSVNTWVKSKNLDVLCPSYEYVGFPTNGWSDIGIINGEFWVFKPSTDETHDAMNGAFLTYNSIDDFTLKRTITHNFGHVNTCHYDKTTDTLLVGNLPGNNEYPAALYIFYGVSEWEDGAQLDFNTVDKTIIDLTAYKSTNNVVACWGENNFAYRNIVYVSAAFNSAWYKIMLGMGENQLQYGTYTPTTNNRYNGTFMVLKDVSYKQDFGSAMPEVVQGIEYVKGRIFTANSDSDIKASMWNFNMLGEIRRTILEFDTLNPSTGEEVVSVAEGVCYDPDTDMMYQGIIHAQSGSNRYYLIKYRL